MAVTWKKLAYEDDVIPETLFDAQSILAATVDNTPAALVLAEQTVVGRITAGNVAALTVGQLQTLINVADGADVTASNAPQAHAASHKDAGIDEILLHELGEPTGAIDINGQQLQDPILHQVADAAALAALTPVIGKIAMQIDTLSAYICTVAA